MFSFTNQNLCLICFYSNCLHFTNVKIKQNTEAFNSLDSCRMISSVGAGNGPLINEFINYLRTIDYHTDDTHLTLTLHGRLT